MDAMKLAAAAVLLLTASAGCADLNVVNPNQPERDQVVRTPNDIEKLVQGSYNSYWLATTHVNGVGPLLNAASFHNSSMAANFGQVERSALPRTPVGNTPADQFASQYEYTWDNIYRAIAGANDGLRAIKGGVVIGTPSANNTPRARAFGRFVQGLTHGTLALLYDKAIVVPETFVYDAAKAPGQQGLAPAPYPEVMAAAMAYLDSAIAVASANTFTIPADWMGTGTVSSADLARLAYFYKARFRALVARTPQERAAVDWARVISDLNASGTTTFNIGFDGGTKWYRYDLYQAQAYGAWGKVASQVYGMADTSGTYQSYMATPIALRKEIVIRTPDLRWPRGESETVQGANPGSFIAYSPGGQSNADRGTWRFSNYVDRRGRSTDQNPLAANYPEVTATEKNMLRAEALYRMGQLGPAADLINLTRVGVGGLPPVGASYSPTAPNCVPRLPNGQCGNFFEAFKYEWRMQSYFIGFGTWYFNSRGWGDLPQGSFLHLPIPARDLQNFGLPVYTTGGGGEGSTGVGTYGY
jgi:hypothetical protein